VTLTAEELAVVESLATPIAYEQRAAFMNAVAQAMAGAAARGPGAPCGGSGAADLRQDIEQRPRLGASCCGGAG
jgi:hypothetical protein